MKLDVIKKETKKIFTNTIDELKNIQWTKRNIILFSPSILLILSGVSYLFSSSLFTFFFSLFLVSLGINIFKITKLIFIAPQNILQTIGQIDGQVLIHKHKAGYNSEKENPFDIEKNEKKIIFH